MTTRKMHFFDRELTDFLYPSTYPAHPIVVTLDKECDCVVRLRVKVTADTFSDIRTMADFFAIHGEPSAIVSGTYPTKSAVSYLFPEKGMVVNGTVSSPDPTANAALELTYYVPMSISEWMNTWGQLYGVRTDLALDPHWQKYEYEVPE